MHINEKSSQNEFDTERKFIPHKSLELNSFTEYFQVPGGLEFGPHLPPLQCTEGEGSRQDEEEEEEVQGKGREG